MNRSHGFPLFSGLLLCLFLPWVVRAQIQPTKQIQPTNIHSRLAEITGLFNAIELPREHFVSNNYHRVEQMQEQCDAAENDLALGMTRPFAATVVEADVQMHMLLASAAVIIDDEELYTLHIETACRRYRQFYGYGHDKCGDELMGAALANYGVIPGKTLRDVFKRLSAEHEAFQNAAVPVEVVFDRSSRIVPLDRFAIQALPDARKTMPGDEAALFAEGMDLRLQNPIVKFWFLQYFLENAKERKLNLKPLDYFVPDPGDVEIQHWASSVKTQFQNDLNPIVMKLRIPEGNYYIYPRDVGPGQNPKPNLIIDGSPGKAPKRIVLKMLESGTRIEVICEYEGLSLANLHPRFEILNFSLGTNNQRHNLEGSAGGRMFQGFGSHLALQTQGQFEFRNYRDRMDLDQVLLDLVGQSPLPRDQRALANYSSREFQLDVGPVFRFKNAQFSVMESLRYVTRSDFDHGGTLGQFFFNAGYVFPKWGQIGVYGTLANVDQPVVKTVQFNNVFFEETYLKVADQVGLNFQIGCPSCKWLPGYFEGSFGYLNTTWVKGAAGGTLRWVTPWPSDRFSFAAEVGYNEGFIRSGENSVRVGVGFRIGKWSPPSAFRNEPGPVPVIVPAIRYETLTRIVRRGNDKPQANAGPDSNNVDPGSTVTLDGRGSFDPDSDPITYKWNQVSGTAVTLSNPTSAAPSFQAGNFGDKYTFSLVVCDNYGLCSTAPSAADCAATNPTDACVTVTVRKAPQIVSFTATPTQVNLGLCSTLKWETTDADHVTLAPDIGEVPAKGSRDVCPSASTKYTLTAYSGTFSVSSDVTVSIAAAQILTFTATPNQIDAGKCSTLNWKVQNALRATIDPGIGEVPLEGSISVCPTTTTTYTLTAFGADNKSITLTAQVTVSAAKIVTFTAAPTEIDVGKCSTLTWKVQSAVRVTLAPGIGEVPLEGSRSVCPTTTTTYTLTAFSADNTSVTQTAQVTVRSVQIVTFTAMPPQVKPGDCSILSWKVQNAVRVSIDPGIGEVSLEGSRSVCPTTTTTYTLTAFGADNKSITRSIQVAVKSVLIVAFTATPMQVNAGQCTTLSWIVQNAVRVTIDPGIGEVPLIGIRSACPSATTTYTLSAFGADNKVVTRSVQVTVAAPKVLSFTADPVVACPSNCTTLKWSTSSAVRVTISPGIGDVPLQGSLQVCPTSTTVYTLTAYGTSPGQTATASVKVTVEPLPEILYFTADRYFIGVGETATLSWATAFADTVTLTPPGAQVSTSNPSYHVSPTCTQRYDLTAKNQCGQVTASLTIFVWGCEAPQGRQ